MKKNFKNNLEDTGISMKSPWDFTQPHYDQRSSCFVNAGSHHGVGYIQPIGSKNHTSKGGVPIGKGMGMTVDEIPMKNLVVEFEN